MRRMRSVCWPTSEIPMIGRNLTYVLALFVFVLFQFCVPYATNIGMLLVYWSLTGFIGSPQWGRKQHLRVTYGA